jgi:predicted nuclease of predicted toxin-antitoxin system
VRVLLDACLPHQLKSHIKGHKIWTARERGWNMLSDKQLLSILAGEIDILITADKNLANQNRIQGREFAVVILRAKTNQLKHLLQLLPQLEAALKRAVPGALIEVALQ